MTNINILPAKPFISTIRNPSLRNKNNKFHVNSSSLNPESNHAEKPSISQIVVAEPINSDNTTPTTNSNNLSRLVKIASNWNLKSRSSSTASNYRPDSEERRKQQTYYFQNEKLELSSNVAQPPSDSQDRISKILLPSRTEKNKTPNTSKINDSIKSEWVVPTPTHQTIELERNGKRVLAMRKNQFGRNFFYKFDNNETTPQLTTTMMSNYDKGATSTTVQLIQLT